MKKEFPDAVIIRAFSGAYEKHHENVQSENSVSNPDIEFLSSSRKERCFFSRFLTSICVAESINVFFPFIVFKERMNCREFNDAISTASFIFCYCILSVSRTAKKSVVLCLNLYLLSQYSFGSDGKPQTYQSAQESTPVLSECKWHTVGFEYRVHYFIGVGFNSPHEYYVLSPQSF